MKAIMVMFDSLNRHMLPNYGCEWIHAPNFKRLAEKTITFENAYVGSLPCMPARRDLHTGRYNFLHRSWGPIEPFDNSMPEILKKNGVYTHLTSDHQHYWEDGGGGTYHNRYSSWEFARGQEGDLWKGEVKEPEYPETEGVQGHPLGQKLFRQDVINRKYFAEEKDYPQAQTFASGLEFIEKNIDEDNWFLQIETFDPHEPFFAHQRFKDLYPHEYNGKQFDWPPYYFVQERDEVVEHARYEYAALLSMCDHYLGLVLDIMDKHDMWKDTMLIVNTDHGYMLGEHGWWSKSVMPVYQEIAHVPMFAWDPRVGKKGERRNSLVQAIDIAPTLLEFFGIDIPNEMTGQPLKEVIAEDEPIRDAAIFGFHGGHLNITDGRYVYMRGPATPENTPLYEYTLMPTQMRQLFSPEELQEIELQQPFEFTKGCQTMKIKASQSALNSFQYGSLLFDLESDPEQKEEITNIDVEVEMINKISQLMKENEAPAEQYERLGIPIDGVVSAQQVIEQKEAVKKTAKVNILEDFEWSRSAQNQFRALLNITPIQQRESILEKFESYMEHGNEKVVNDQAVVSFLQSDVEGELKNKALYFVKLAARTR